MRSAVSPSAPIRPRRVVQDWLSAALQGDCERRMRSIVLRVRLVASDRTHLTYDGSDQDEEVEILDQVIALLSRDSGDLHGRHSSG